MSPLPDPSSPFCHCSLLFHHDLHLIHSFFSLVLNLHLSRLSIPGSGSLPAMAIRLRLSGAISRLTRPNAAIIELWLLAALVIGVSAAFARRYPLRGNSETLTDIGKMAHYGHAEFWRWLLGIALLTAACGNRSISRAQGRPPELLADPCWRSWRRHRFCGDVPSTPSTCSYINAARSRLYTEYGLDPLTASPISTSTAIPISTTRRRNGSSRLSLWTAVESHRRSRDDFRRREHHKGLDRLQDHLRRGISRLRRIDLAHGGADASRRRDCGRNGISRNCSYSGRGSETRTTIW